MGRRAAWLGAVSAGRVIQARLRLWRTYLREYCCLDLLCPTAGRFARSGARIYTLTGGGQRRRLAAHGGRRTTAGGWGWGWLATAGGSGRLGLAHNWWGPWLRLRGLAAAAVRRAWQPQI